MIKLLQKSLVKINGKAKMKMTLKTIGMMKTKKKKKYQSQPLRSKLPVKIRRKNQDLMRKLQELKKRKTTGQKQGRKS